MRKKRSRTPARIRPLEPAPLGPDAQGVGSLRHPPPGPHISAARRVLSPVPDEARRLPDGGAQRVLRDSGLREQVPFLCARRTGAGGEGQRAHAHRSRARGLRGRPLLGRARRHSGRDERGAHPQPRRGVGRPLRGARLPGLRAIRLHLREQGRGHRRDAAPPARPDLRLSLYPSASREGAPRRQRAPLRGPLPALRSPLTGTRGRTPNRRQGRALQHLRPVLRPLPLRGARLRPPLHSLHSGPERGGEGRPRPSTETVARRLRPPFRLLAAVHDGHAPGPHRRGGLPGSRPLPHRVLPAEPYRRQAEVPGQQRDRGRSLYRGRPARADRSDAQGSTRGPRAVKLLVTGGAGYIGSVVAHQLLEASRETVVLDNLSTGYERAVPEGARFLKGDLLDAEEVSNALSEGFDGVLHFAALSLVGESFEQPELYYRNNVCGTLNLLEAMREAGVFRLVFSSTAAVYGEPEEVPIPESAPALPTNPYGASKLAVDRMIGAVCEARGLAATSLRYFNVAGASGRFGEDHHPETHLIPLVLEAAAEGSSVKIFGTDYPTRDGTAVRDYIHVEDLGRAHLLALVATGPGEHSVYNLGNGAGFSVREVVEAARRITGQSIDAVEAPRRAGDPPTLVASSEKIQADLGWKPEKPELETMISDAWTWMQDHPNGYE